MDRLASLIAELRMHVICLSLPEQVKALNLVRASLHQISPFSSEPVDCVLWVPESTVGANDYNPNSVAPPEMELLKVSILQDGYTQPIVGWKVEEGKTEVIDGFHRNRVGKECSEVKERIHGYLPISFINADREEKGDRIASTIRHNRARGKHKVEAMSDIVTELKRRNWSDERIAKNLGMDSDEVLRLCQINGLANMFQDQKFSEAWEHTGQGEQLAFEEEEDFDAFVLSAAKSKRLPGWNKVSEISHVKIGMNANHLGFVQKSRFRNEWFWYAYADNMRESKGTSLSEGKTATLEEAQAQVDVLSST